MNILIIGDSVWCSLDRYGGRHDIRLLGARDCPHYDYRFAPESEMLDQVLKRLAPDFRPDMILCWYPEMYPPPRGIEDSPVFTAAVVSDWNVSYPILETNLARYDVVLCDKPGVGVLNSDLVNARHLMPLYSQLSQWHKPHDVDKDIDVLMLGNMNHAAHARRARYLERIAALSDRCTVFIGEGFVDDAYALMLSRARIVFNHSIRGELNLRIFETFACGSLAFIEEDNLEARDWFEDGREVVFYNERNLEERIFYYLDHPEQARAIAARGHARAPEFAGENRFDDLIERLGGLPRGERAFCKLPETERVFQTLFMFNCSPWPEYHAVEDRLIREAAPQLQDDPRFWTLLGKYLLSRRSADRTDESYLKPFVQASRLRPASAPYALNRGTALNLAGRCEQAAGCFQHVLNLEDLEGCLFLLGGHGDAFWARWVRYAAEGRVAIALLHAEANIRIARFLATVGQLQPALAALEQARCLDPDNYKDVELRSELLWSTGQRREAAALLDEHLNHLPFAFETRRRLAEYWTELKRHDRARELVRNTERIRNGYQGKLA